MYIVSGGWYHYPAAEVTRLPSTFTVYIWKSFLSVQWRPSDFFALIAHTRNVGARIKYAAWPAQRELRTTFLTLRSILSVQ